MTAVDRPLPDLTGLVGVFHELLANGTLHLQRCETCARWYYPAREFCAASTDHALTWRPTTGLGTAYSWTVTHQALNPAFAADVPYLTALVELDEGPRLVGRLSGVEPSEMRVGLAVRVQPVDVGDVTIVSFVTQ